ncbi:MULTISPECIES: DNA cytosine methyltransferase [unclassified Desulfovibrio]|uniref:DNA cytosine methyltransferase n=1 Tax=unclassified Desulfovibrio TaxID=2593640 RepID=UPI002FDAF74D
MIPVIDVFAGPGGLAEGFSSIQEATGTVFAVRLSVEKETEPFQTLQLRAFYRQFQYGDVPEEYYQFLRKEIVLATLIEKYPAQMKAARDETWQATLGQCDTNELDSRIQAALSGENNWVLIGGPPCQAYSTAGIVGNRTKANYQPEHDERYTLYQEYIRIIAKHQPSIFVMENVPGMLFAKLDGKKIVDDVIDGLRKPGEFAYRKFGIWPDAPGYRLASLSTGLSAYDDSAGVFLVNCEEYGIPQSRQRVIILGFREDLDISSFKPPSVAAITSTGSVLSDLPKLRSKLSKEPDGLEEWRTVFANLEDAAWVENAGELHGKKLRESITQVARILCQKSPKAYGEDFSKCAGKASWNADWYFDPKLGGVLHHEARPHIRMDLHRYLFCACFLKVKGKSPKLPDFPEDLLPKHQNATSGDFKDRFRAVPSGKPSHTIISHLAKDGHAFIHYDPKQCRSITPREAARIQTFPDNYYFFGGRASQFRQIGNAVPPWLAHIIAKSILPIFQKLK